MKWVIIMNNDNARLLRILGIPAIVLGPIIGFLVVAEDIDSRHAPTADAALFTFLGIIAVGVIIGIALLVASRKKWF